MPLDRYRAGVVLSDKYQLDTLLGEGGMGAVWQATNLLLDLPVAIKLIRGDLDRDTLRARLQLEARSAAKLGHPGIVRVFDVGETEFGDPFIVMELIQGETLAQVITRGRLSAARAVQLLLPVIDALGVAHGRGIVHRDLKPDNVMLALEQQRLQPKILDFGIAKLTHPHESDRRLTEVGTLVGSPDYMSPEQARGSDEVDPGSDIWSICVVLYEAVTGAVPFSASNYNALLRAIVENAPNPISAHSAGDAALWTIIERGLAKDRAQRYADMPELGRALAAWLLGHGIGEDACGTSLEAKWLGRGGEPILAQTPHPARAMSADFEGNSRESYSGLRGPFTATIRPSGTSTKTLSLAVGICSLLAVAGIALSRDPKHAPAQTGVGISAASPLATAKSTLHASVAATQPASRQDATSEIRNAPLAASAVVEHESAPVVTNSVQVKQQSRKPAPRVTQFARTTGVARVTPPAALPAPTPAPATAKNSAKPLDLLAPY